MAFDYSIGLTAGEEENLYVSDTVNSAVRPIKNGEVTILAIRDISVFPASPVDLAVCGSKLYACDSFARKVFVVFSGTNRGDAF